MVCTYLPHALATRPDAVRVPMYHRNIDYDEFTFMHGGSHLSRQTVTTGMITLHPGPIHHGPYKEAIERSWEMERIEWQAVAIDTVKPLKATAAAEQAEDKEYYRSWRSGS
jgi:homogentisate 1,2-dioxygenase